MRKKIIVITVILLTVAFLAVTGITDVIASSIGHGVVAD